jgi:hypothetical protein
MQHALRMLRDAPILAPSMTSVAPAPQPPARLSRWTGVAQPWLAALLLAHVAFVAMRFPQGSVRKRGQLVEAAQAAGPLWHFVHADGETKRLVAWLVRAVPQDAAVAYQGPGRGLLEPLAAVLAPRLVVHVDAVQPDGTAFGRRVFAGHPAGEDADGRIGVVDATDGSELRWSLRRKP